ncbi:MAG: hypothetical protein ABI625_22315 [bacterium]
MIDWSRTFRPIAAVFGAAILLAAPLRAQDASLAVAPSSPAPAVAEAPAAAAGPTVAAATVAVRRAPVDANAPAAPAAGQGHDKGTALMIVGGAAVLTGIVIGNGAGYAISVAGAVAGLYGLYIYLQ